MTYSGLILFLKNTLQNCWQLEILETCLFHEGAGMEPGICNVRSSVLPFLWNDKAKIMTGAAENFVENSRRASLPYPTTKCPGAFLNKRWEASTFVHSVYVKHALVHPPHRVCKAVVPPWCNSIQIALNFEQWLLAYNIHRDVKRC